MGEKLDKFLGCVYGLAIGDALGFPVEFIDLEQIKEKYGNEGIKDFDSFSKFPAGTYTDDTQMTLAVANGILISEDPYDLNDVMGNISQEFVKWYKNPENNRAPGNTCMAGCRNLDKGVHWLASGLDSKGCGAAMRSAPIGLFYEDLNKIIEVARAASMCTHSHPTGVASGIATACLTYFALNNNDPKNMFIEVCNTIVDYDSDREMAKKIFLVQKVKDLKPEEAMPQLGEGWVGDEAVAIALYSFLKNPKDYEKTIITAANITGDSDSTACIAGAISGAYNGINAIPEKWIKKIENSDLLRKIAEDLYQKKIDNQK